MKTFVWLLLALWAGTASFASAAQEKPPEVIHTGFAEFLAWSADSHLLVFYDGLTDRTDYEMPDVEVTQPNWYTYDVRTGKITTGSTWPLMPDLSADELELLRPNAQPNTYMYPSPNGKYLAYTQKPLPDTFFVHPYALSNRREVVDMGFNVGGDMPRNFRMVWSADSRAFAIADFCCEEGPNIGFTYVTGYAGADRLQQPEVISFAFVEIGSRQFLPIGVDVIFDQQTVHDMTDDGSGVLLTSLEIFEDGRIPADGASRIKLILWRPNNPQSSLIFDDIDGDRLKLASFYPGDETRLLLFTMQGLLRYDIQTHELEVVRDDFTAADALIAQFSPDGRWLALIVKDSLYLVAVRDGLKG